MWDWLPYDDAARFCTQPTMTACLCVFRRWPRARAAREWTQSFEPVPISANAWRKHVRGLLCPVDPHQRWVLSPLGCPIAVLHYAAAWDVINALDTPDPAGLIRRATEAPSTLRAEGAARVDDWPHFLSLAKDPHIRSHILGLRPIVWHDPHMDKAVQISRSLDAALAASVALVEIESILR